MKLPFFFIIITLQFHSIYNTDYIPLLPLIILSASEKQVCSILPCNSFDLNFYLITSKFFFETFEIRNIKYHLLLPFVSIWDDFPMTPQHICSCSSIFSTATAAAAKSLQSCPTLCDPIDSSPPGSPVPRILQARSLEWGAIAFSNAWKWKVKVRLLSHVRLFATAWTAAYQAPPSMGFSRQGWGAIAFSDLQHSTLKNHSSYYSCCSSHLICFLHPSRLACSWVKMHIMMYLDSCPRS